jgi:hypothetical protein
MEKNLKTNFMKKILNDSMNGLTEMSEMEMSNINGGDLGFWGWLGYVAGATARGFYEFSKTAAEYQASLPANLKK